ncbi:hypothetical protein RhiirB3_473519 [Rhizophagus irregularis]|nr:hypothetical protein RhiirB3_473519 [Rhizophagus irregularis]
MTSTTLTSSSTLSQETSMSSFELTQEVLEAARDSLLEQETQIILAENISRDIPVKIRLVDGKVIAYEVALTLHVVVAGYMSHLGEPHCWTLLMPLFDHGMFLILHLHELATHQLKDGNSDLQPLYLLDFWTYNYLWRPTLVTGNVTGSPPCIGLNLPNYILNIPANALFHGASGGVPNGMAGGINIDLWQIQNHL